MLKKESIDIKIERFTEALAKASSKKKAKLQVKLAELQAQKTAL